jgi:hypothetical protein
MDWMREERVRMSGRTWINSGAEIICRGWMHCESSTSVGVTRQKPSMVDPSVADLLELTSVTFTSKFRGSNSSSNTLLSDVRLQETVI